MKNRWISLLLVCIMVLLPAGSFAFDIKLDFSDSDEISNWAMDSIKKAYHLKIVQGSNGKFNPKGKITRAEFTKMIVGILQLDIHTDNTIHFSDVNHTDWFYPYINACYQYGIVQGDGGEFNPNKTITREEMAVMLSRIIQLNSNNNADIKDIEGVSSWAKKDIENIYASGIMTGSEGYFNPKKDATREMAVVVAVRCLDKEKKELTKVKEKDTEVSKYIEDTGRYLINVVDNPTVSSIGGEWAVLSLLRSHLDVPDDFKESYLNNLKNTLEEKDGKLHRIKYTEYDRVILALSSMGKSAKDVYGYDLTLPLVDFNTLIKQGLNGPIWALIALDTRGYEIPIDKTVSTQTTRELLIEYILERELEGGGWSLTSELPADADITGMALQALSKYQEQDHVKESISKALEFLSKTQKSDGSFASSWDTNSSSESISQVIVALTALGIDPKTDERFVKKGKDPISALLEFQTEKGGFEHAKSMGPNQMATEQAMYALVAYDRFLKGKNTLYDMTDIK